jgi:Mrp family chromosome partitioning ATPase
VLAAEKTPKPSVVRAVEQIQGVGGKVIGVVLNRVNLERNSYYYSQYYGEYYRSYYAADGAGAARDSARKGSPRPGARSARRA